MRDSVPADQTQSCAPVPTTWSVAVGFWVLGLINNSAYVIMIAGATEIAAGAVGLVYFCAIGPTLVVKVTAPYWFHLVSYTLRMRAAAACMAGAFLVVALSSHMGGQLLGVALAAVQGGLGEATLLALCALYPQRLALTAWSSGTGFAGVAGYAWVAVLHQWLRLSFSTTLLAATVLPVAWLVAFTWLQGHSSSSRLGGHSYQEVPLDEAEVEQDLAGGQLSAESSSCELAVSPGTRPPADVTAESARPALQPPTAAPSSATMPDPAAGAAGGSNAGVVWSHMLGSSSSGGTAAVTTAPKNWRERLKATAGLWRYMVPLFVVYFAEYAMQSGTWTAIGFPVTSTAARQRFYLYANWAYQLGVFVSRSSGTVFQASMGVLWAMPALQAALLAFFTWDAVSHWWYGWSLLLLCLVVGLLGGAVYVNAFTLLCRQVPQQLQEFSLSATCVADSCGIACADLMAILIQGCLYRWNGLPGAAYAC